MGVCVEEKNNRGGCAQHARKRLSCCFATAVCVVKKRLAGKVGNQWGQFYFRFKWNGRKEQCLGFCTLFLNWCGKGGKNPIKSENQCKFYDFFFFFLFCKLSHHFPGHQLNMMIMQLMGGEVKILFFFIFFCLDQSKTLDNRLQEQTLFHQSGWMHLTYMMSRCYNLYSD